MQPTHIYLSMKQNFPVYNPYLDIDCHELTFYLFPVAKGFIIALGIANKSAIDLVMSQRLDTSLNKENFFQIVNKMTRLKHP